MSRSLGLRLRLWIWRAHADLRFQLLGWRWHCYVGRYGVDLKLGPIAMHFGLGTLTPERFGVDVLLAAYDESHDESRCFYLQPTRRRGYPKAEFVRTNWAAVRAYAESIGVHERQT